MPALFVAGVAGSCVYYNTFFHAKQAFNQAEEARKNSPPERPTIRTTEYNRAIEKSLKVVENYPNSKYYDDALYVLAASYFYTKQYRKAERRARELLTNYPESKYALDARLYLAKARLEQLDIEAAMETFTELFESDIERDVKTEAAMALGTFHFENKRYADAQRYFLAVRDSLGSKHQQKVAQRFIADGHFNRFQFQDALGAYLQMLGMDPDNNEKYHALFRAAQCSYRLYRIADGQDYLEALAQDEIYFDSLGILKLSLAEGYELEDDLDQAEALYQEVVDEEKIRRVAAEAAYNLGLIYQFDYDNLKKAKEYYDKVVELDRSSEMGQDALQRAGDIAKLESFTRAELDTAATQDAIDDAAYTQYQLAELYWFKLNKPDTAMLELQYIIDSLPAAYDAPKAMIALAEMVRDHEGDSGKADSILHEMLVRYPHSDFVPEALENLGLKGTEADTGYALRHIQLAENFLLDDESVDSARAHYQYVADNFKDSRFYLQARFSLIWLTEMYDSPGDSSVIYAYQEFVDSFPGTDWAREALKRFQYTPPAPVRSEAESDTGQAGIPGQADEFSFGEEADTLGDTSDVYEDPLKALYKAPDGTEASDLPAAVEPIEIREPFIYPTEAYASAWYGDIYFQLQLDFTGEVIDYKRMTSSGIDELDRRAEETLASTIFDVTLLRPEMQGLWFVYRFRVTLPPDLR
ncbi:MAG: tetratricopeptide repeat protein [Candidatus Zixiibacteriota bacterium]